MDSYSSEVISFELYMEHYNKESQKIDAIMNFYEVAFKRQYNALNLRDFKLYHKIPKFPALKVEQSLYPSKIITGYEAIETFLI